jgi:hypothetical protein
MGRLNSPVDKSLAVSAAGGKTTVLTTRHLEARDCGMHATYSLGLSRADHVRCAGLIDAKAAFSYLVTIAQHRKFQPINV